MADYPCPRCHRHHGAIDRVELHFADGTTMTLDDEHAQRWMDRETMSGSLQCPDPWRVWHGAPQPGEVCSICNQPVDDHWARIGDVLRHASCREPTPKRSVPPEKT